MQVNEKAFLELLQQHQGIIYKLVLLYATDNEEKKDLYQEIVLQCWKSYGSFKHEAKFSTWLYRIALNTILTQKRKETVIDYTDRVETYSNSLSTTPSQAAPLPSIPWAIRQLAETDRAIISMHLDGYDHAEIAMVLGISQNHVAVKLHRIKQQLKTILKFDI